MTQITPIPPSPYSYTAEGGGNEAVTLQVNGEHTCKLLWVGVAYTENVTKNVTVKYMSPLGVKYNVKIYTIALTSASDGFWLVNGDLRITDKEYFQVTAPAGGAGVKATITAMVEPLHAADSPPYSRLITGSVSYSNTTSIIGAMPPKAKITGLEINILTGFNSDGSNMVNIGHDDDHAAYAQNIDVSTPGIIILALVKPGESAVRTVKAYYTAGGSTATAGSGNITVKYQVL